MGCHNGNLRCHSEDVVGRLAVVGGPTFVGGLTIFRLQI